MNLRERISQWFFRSIWYRVSVLESSHGNALNLAFKQIAELEQRVYKLEGKKPKRKKSPKKR